MLRIRRWLNHLFGKDLSSLYPPKTETSHALQHQKPLEKERIMQVNEIPSFSLTKGSKVRIKMNNNKIHDFVINDVIINVINDQIIFTDDHFSKRVFVISSIESFL